MQRTFVEKTFEEMRGKKGALMINLLSLLHSAITDQSSYKERRDDGRDVIKNLRPARRDKGCSARCQVFNVIIQCREQL